MKKLLMMAALLGFAVACGGANKADENNEEAQTPEVEVVVEETTEAAAKAPEKQPEVAEKEVETMSANAGVKKAASDVEKASQDLVELSAAKGKEFEGKVETAVNAGVREAKNQTKKLVVNGAEAASKKIEDANFEAKEVMNTTGVKVVKK